MSQTKQLAAGITFLVCCAIFIVLLIVKLTWSAKQAEEDTHLHVTLAEIPEEEFLDVEIIPIPGESEELAAPAETPEDMDNESQPAPQSGTNVTTQGKVDKPVQTVTQQKPSTVKEKQKPTPAKPSAAADNKRLEEEKAMAKQTQSNVTNAFSKAENKNNSQNGTKDEGQAGKKDGNPESGAGPSANGTKIGTSSGTVGGGWKMPAYPRNIPSNEVGSVTFEVVVNKDGTVGKITPISNSGLTSATIAKCRNEIQKHRFTHTNPSTAEATTARITFTFKDPK